ncbi:phage tail assembly protein, partial [Escherichia coli]|uniref:phage tail assembly protein n=1 Tax=Escherichia coli TaxID=562 RepID=UPI003EE3D00E
DLKQVRKISKNPADWDEPLIARSTGLLPEDLDNMDLADYLQLRRKAMRSVFPSDLSVPENQWSGGSYASIKSSSLRAFERV